MHLKKKKNQYQFSMVFSIMKGICFYHSNFALCITVHTRPVEVPDISTHYNNYSQMTVPADKLDYISNSV